MSFCSFASARRTMSACTKTKLKAVFIDLSGTLHIDDEPTNNAVAALERLRKQPDISIRFVTNTTKESRRTLFNRLQRIGFNSVTEDDMFTSLSAAVRYVRSNKLSPLYLLTDDAKQEFGPLDLSDSGATQDSVVVGLAPEQFTYERMNEAFRVLMASKSNSLIAVHEGKYYKRGDGLAVGPGCFTRGLEYATGKKAIVIGKPNRYFFECVIPDNVTAAECCMIGDDLNDDVCGAMKAGMKGILVRTGKYIENIESTAENPPTKVIDSFADAVDWLLEEKLTI